MSLPAPAEPAGALELSERLSHNFGDPELLRLALTHRSWVAEVTDDEPNERLEFLGDAVLGLAVTDQLYRLFPDHSEGELAKVRAAVVSAPSLAHVARRIQVGPHLRLGRGEDASGGRTKSSILADAVEALIGAVYLDGGWEPAKALVIRLLGEQIEDVTAAGPGAGDYKTRLQELVAHLGHAPPGYTVEESGPDHNKRFLATVVIDQIARGSGTGTSKKQAEQQAAEEAWAALSPPSDNTTNETMTERPESRPTLDERAQADV